MKVLALNTSFKNTYVVVINENKTSTKMMDSKLKQSENVLQIIHQALTECGLKISQLDAIACVIGPGSFTGIRIGLSLAKGFLLPFNKIKFIPVSSFELMVAEARKNGINDEITCVLNALSGKFFIQSFDKKNDKINEPTLVEGDKVNEIIGTKVGLVEENVSFCNKFVDFTLKSFEEIVAYKFQNKIFTSTLEPLYIRKSQAEDELEKKRANND